VTENYDIQGTILIPQSTQEQRRAAQLAVCARATDVDDARALLETLDLLEES
jgi:hypothetical protein